MDGPASRCGRWRVNVFHTFDFLTLASSYYYRQRKYIFCLRIQLFSGIFRSDLVSTVHEICRQYMCTDVCIHCMGFTWHLRAKLSTYHLTWRSYTYFSIWNHIRQSRNRQKTHFLQWKWKFCWIFNCGWLITLMAWLPQGPASPKRGKRLWQLLRK